MSWLSGLTTTLAGFMTNPLLFLLGVAAVASPIIIHLLNKRKFRRVEWAAMDFLLEADKKNRRRVRLENLLLLLLRCLACILIGLLLARPFKSLGLMSRFLATEEYERIVLLDDSLSMAARDGTQTSMDKAKAALQDFVKGLADGKNNAFTLHLTSDPAHPKYNATKIDDASVTEIAAVVKDEIQVADRPANLEQALLELEKSVKGRTSGGVNRVVYVISDMRRRDWPAAADGGADESSVATVLKRLAEDVAGCFVVDVGRQDDAGNLVIEEINPLEKALVSGVQSPFEVRVRNAGQRGVSDAKVRFVAGQGQPLVLNLPPIKPGETVVAPLKYTFVKSDLNPADARPEYVRIRAELEAPAAPDVDELMEDNARYFAARVAPGIRTLIVDGDQQDGYASESYFLRRALAPPGQVLSGVAVDVVGESVFETTRLEDYQVIYLCNLLRLPDFGGAPVEGGADEAPAAATEGDGRKHLSRREELERWVADGGGLVIAVGDRVDEEAYDRELYRDGKGLLPATLDGLLGDVDEKTWVQFNVQTANHPVMSLFALQDNPFIDAVKIFRWWNCKVDEAAIAAGTVNIPARFTNLESSPAVVEKQFGEGRVLLFAIPLDNDWADWPQDLSYLPTMLELNKYMARKTSDDANMQVGESLHQTVDLNHYDLNVTVQRPDAVADSVLAVPPEEATIQEVLYTADYADTDRQGFYDVLLNRRDGSGSDAVLFAANIDPREGDLGRADTKQFERQLGDANVALVTQEGLVALGVDNAKGEWWRWALGALLVVLCAEQVLAWLFGRRR
ncbi:MAG: BatA domain-containing protein [Planctomycetales bacterium]|nr:BatA domain-containing protein [Planctomycetales bacterium]